MLHDDARHAGEARPADVAVIVGIRVVGTVAVGVVAVLADLVDDAGLGAAVLDAELAQLGEDRVGKRLAHGVGALVVARVIGVVDLGARAARSVDVEAHVDVAAGALRAVNALLKARALVLRARAEDLDAGVELKLGTAILVDLPGHVGFLGAVGGGAGVVAAVAGVERDHKVTGGVGERGHLEVLGKKLVLVGGDGLRRDLVLAREGCHVGKKRGVDPARRGNRESAARTLAIREIDHGRGVARGIGERRERVGALGRRREREEDPRVARVGERERHQLARRLLAQGQLGRGYTFGRGSEAEGDVLLRAGGEARRIDVDELDDVLGRERRHLNSRGLRGGGKGNGGGDGPREERSSG